MTFQYCEKLSLVVDWGLFCTVEQKLPTQQTNKQTNKQKESKNKNK
jgi:hypothetical protein